MHSLPYRQAWAVDFEFTAPPGEQPVPICVVARELQTNCIERVWLADNAPPLPPFGLGEDCLYIAYYASAELGCHLALDWPLPARILDLFAEFRRRTNGLPTPCGNGLLGALAYFGLDALAATEKVEMRQLAMRGGPFTSVEQTALIDYCQSDVDALARLLPAMLPKIDLPRALLRGRYMAAAARMEWNGIPIDTEALTRFRESWDRIKSHVIEKVDIHYGVYVPTGQRPINPQSTRGAAILQTAAEWHIDPHALADALDEVWQEEREAGAASRAARRIARKVTGLTTDRINQLADLGHDHANVPGLDATARELASLFPELGIGRGYDPDAPDEDYASKLYATLQDHSETTRPKYHPDLLRQAAERVAAAPPVNPYRGPLSFSEKRFAAYLAREHIPWPRLESGALDLDDDTFGEMARIYPEQIGPLRNLHYTLSQLRLHDLTVGVDGRNRCLLSAFGARTGRNAPSNSKFIFGPATWIRSLIQPQPDWAIAYIDWSQQELAIAAALSGDPRMQAAYQSEDFYLTFAKRVGAVPADATKKTHSTEREQFKTVSLGVLFGMTAKGLARKLNVPPCKGRELLQMHQETFRQFWDWIDRVGMRAVLTGKMRTVFGWPLHIGPNTKPQTIRNFPMQAHGAEMLRLACCLATERGIRVCAPIHDALLIEAADTDIEREVERTQEAMREASEAVLPGFPLRSEAKIVRYPDRYSDPRGAAFWETVWQLIEEVNQEEVGSSAGDTGWGSADASR
jgi:hypothetical protein